MITKITLQHFKSFQELDLPLSPITILAGANSSGKSSVIQSLLLLRQTLQGPRTRPLIISGNLINFANFTELVFEKQPSRYVRIGIDIIVEKLPDTVTDHLLSTIFSPAEINVIRSGTSQMNVRYLLTFAKGQRPRDVAIIAVWTQVIFGSLADRPIVLDVTMDNDRCEGNFQYWDPEEGNERSLTFTEVIEWAHFLPQTVSGADATVEQISEVGFEQIPVDLFGLSALNNELCNRIHYVGPLRSEPRRAYLNQGEHVLLDTTGSNVLQVLLAEQKRRVMYWSKDDTQPIDLPLIDAVNKVLLEVLELSQSIQPISLSDVASQLTLPFIPEVRADGYVSEDDSHYVTFADVGFGLSQILPIVVAGLLAQTGDTLIAEQPETHLHPRIQANLASYFALLHRLRKRVIVETHSEHLITGLRQEIVADDTDADEQAPLSKAIKIVFVRPPSKEKRGASIEELAFDEYGYPGPWPEEFLPRSMVENQRFLRAVANKRSKKPEV